MLYLVVALLLGFALGVLALLLFRRRPDVPVGARPRGPPPGKTAAHAPPAPVAPPRAPPEQAADDDWEETVDFAIVEDEPEPAPAPPPRAPAPTTPPPPPHRGPPPRPYVPEMEQEGVVPTEWARRHVGPLEPGRVKGICSGCGTPISISKRRPIRVACPVCGRTRLLS